MTGFDLVSRSHQIVFVFVTIQNDLKNAIRLHNVLVNDISTADHDGIKRGTIVTTEESIYGTYLGMEKTEDD